MSGYGFVTSSKNQGQYPRHCASCGKPTFHTCARRKGWFTLFFVPLIPLGRGYSVAKCNLCGLEADAKAIDGELTAVEVETKMCPDCAEPVRLEARVCRYCGYRFSQEETAAARRFAESETARIDRAHLSEHLGQKARAMSILGWLVAMPGILVSVLAGGLAISVIGNPGPDQPASLGILALWLFLSLPAMLGLYLLSKGRKIRRRERSERREEEDVPVMLSGESDV